VEYPTSGTEEEVPVRCYSGRSYADRPLAFHWRGEEVAVEEVLAEWREPAGPAFRVRTPQGSCILRYDEAADRWWVRRLSSGRHA
jgi:hypothetical protein